MVLSSAAIMLFKCRKGKREIERAMEKKNSIYGDLFDALVELFLMISSSIFTI